MRQSRRVAGPFEAHSHLEVRFLAGRRREAYARLSPAAFSGRPRGDRNDREGGPMKRRTGLVYAGIAALFIVLAGCSKKTETASQTGGDSLLSTNPQEQGQGNLTPQQGYASQSPPPARTSAPAPS